MTSDTIADGSRRHAPGRHPWHDTSLSADERARALVGAMTRAEKAAQLGSVWIAANAGDFAPAFDDAPRADDDFASGLGQLTRVFGTEPLTVAEGVARLRELQDRVMAANRLGIPALAHEECLTGLAAYGATAYPAPLAWAASFDEELVRRMARAIGEDMAAIGIHQGLAPVLDVVKDYRWGRVEETLGEDPYVVAQLGSAYVAGLEGAGVIATLKHFAGYSASRGGRNHGPVSMGARELADTVLPPFEAAVRLGGARSVMTAYHDLDGVASTANPDLYSRILREEWGFDGTVVADYWAIPFLATMHRVARDATDAGLLALRAGVDVELPQTVSYRDLAGHVDRGDLDEDVLDRAAERHLRQKIEAGLLDGGPVVPVGAEDVDLDSPRNRAISARLAEESLVLLRDDDALPLRGERIAVVGPAASQIRSLLGCYTFPNHVLSKRPGHDLGIEIPTIVDRLVAEFGAERVRSAPGCGILDDDLSQLGDAVALARDSDVAVVVVGDIAGLFGDGSSGEGCDVRDLRLPGGQHELVMGVLATGIPTVLVVVSGRPYALGEYGAAAAIVQAFFPGAEGAAAIAGLLSGRVRATGRLPVQIPRDPRITGTYLEPALGRHNPGATVVDPTPLYPFGFGLTDGDVRYRSIEVGGPTRTDGALDVTVAVENAGADTVEVVQLYVSYAVSSTVRPAAQLIGFARIELTAGAERRVRFRVDAGRLAATGIDGRLAVEPGGVTFSAGPSAADRPCRASVTLTGPAHHPSRRSLRTPWTVS